MQDVLPANRTALTAIKTLASGNPPNFGPYVPCNAIHPWVESCLEVPLLRLMTVFKWAFPIYGALHFLPMFMFKWKAFVSNPMTMLRKAGWGTTRSATFLAAFIASFQCKCLTQMAPGAILDNMQIAWVCLKHYLYNVLSSQKRLRLPQSMINLLVSKYSYSLGGFFGALSILIEERRRRGELAMYALPKALESAWLTARGKGLVLRTGKAGEALVSVLTGLVLYPC